MIGAEWTMRGSITSMEERIGCSLPKRECWFVWPEKGWALLERLRPENALYYRLSVWTYHDPRPELKRVLALPESDECPMSGCDREEHDGLHENAKLGKETKVGMICSHCPAIVGTIGMAFFFEGLEGLADKIICGACLLKRNP